MNRDYLPRIKLSAKPQSLTFRAPKNAFDKWDRTIKAKSTNDAALAIDIMGEIGESFWSEEFTTAAMVKKQLDAAGNSPVVVTLNSPGGNAFEGIAIYNLLREHKGKVTVNVLGMAASAASVIAMAGDTVRMGEAAFLMIHSAWGVVMGNRNDMREFADTLDALNTSVAEVYARRSGMHVADVTAMMEKETWMTAGDAVKNGFADTTFGDEKKKAKQSVDAVPASGQERQRPSPVVSLKSPGASGQIFLKTPKDTQMPATIKERIQQSEASRQAKAARLAELMNEDDGNTTLDESQQQEYDGLFAEVKALDAHLVRLHQTDEINRASITPIVEERSPAPTPAVPALSGVRLKSNLAPGQKFARYALALKRSHGNLTAALAHVQNNADWMSSSPELAKVFMTAVAAGNTTTSGWASQLVYAENLANEFIEYLRPATIIGQIGNWRRVPFNVRMGSQTAGSTGYWVGQGLPIPVSKLTVSSTSLGITKAAGMVVLDDELVRSSSPSAELLVRDDLRDTIVALLDLALIDPNQGGVANVQPASLLYGVTPVTPSAATVAGLIADLKTLFSTMIAANVPISSCYWVMSPTTALGLSLILTSLGNQQFPGITINGGTFQGLPVVVSNQAKIPLSPQFGEMIVLINPREVFLADDGQVTIEISNEASIEMLDNPTNQSTGSTAATAMVSMFQTNSEAIKAVRYINWVKRRASAAAFIQAAAYTG